MKVLSLFDGMSCGQIALERAGIEVEKYFASEIDQSAIQITQENYPETIQLGDITEIKGRNLPKIDLLIGGSPCQGFSFVGKMLNFDDPRSALFFEYVRLLRELKPKYFLLENVRMKKEVKDLISKEIGVEPVFICSSNFSPQKRKRLYWTNLPIEEMKESKDGLVLQDIIEENPKEDKLFLDEKQTQRGVRKHSAQILGTGTRMGAVKWPTPIHEKSKCLNTMRIKGDRSMTHIPTPDGIRLLTPLEYERLQTVPEGYTSSAPENERYRMLGNGWTIDAVAHIFKNLF